MRKNKTLYSCGVIISILIIILVIIFSIYNRKSKQQTNTIVESVSQQEENNTELASTSIDKNIQETEQEILQVIPEKEQSVNTEAKDEIKPTESKPEKQEDISDTLTFNMPVDGEILRDYAKDKLIYSDTLKEWVTHTGIDIKSPKTTIVKSSAPGKITAIKNDPRFGLSVVIEHKDGYSTVYSNLYTAEFVTVGEQVNQGQTIGTVGNTAAFEILDEPHLHFEILKNGVQVDPNMYL